MLSTNQVFGAYRVDLTNFINHLVKEFDVQSILCYGSYAQMLQDERSDIDLLILLKSSILSPQARKKCYDKFSNVHITTLDENLSNRWDVSWTPINDRLMLQTQAIDIGYNTTQWVSSVIDKLIIENKITFDEFPFRPYTFLGLLESSKILYDEDNFIKECLVKIRPMPVKLKKAIIDSFLPILKESYEDLMDYSGRNIGILAFEFQLFRGIDAIIGILFAINEVYDPASKRTEAFLFKLKKQPANLSDFIINILPGFYENQKLVIQFFKESIDFIEKNMD